MTTGCFDIHTPSKPAKDYFIASNDALQRLVATMARYDGNCPLCGFALDLQSYSAVVHAARISISCVVGHSVTEMVLKLYRWWKIYSGL